MAVNTPSTKPTTVSERARDDADDLMTQAGAVVSDARDAAASVAARAPEVAEATRGAVQDAFRQLEAGSDEALAIGTFFALGASLGMLIGGAPRLLIAATLVPVAAAGLILLDRQAGRTATPRQRS